jgi:hypothetical protein
VEYFSEPNRIIEQELVKFPQARLQDIYKVFYQGTFGPAHFIKSRQQAEKNLRAELEQINFRKSSDFFQNISYLGWFYRVDLSYIFKTEISIHQFCDFFYRSSLIARPISHKKWKKEWKNLENGYLLKNFEIPHIKKDKKWLRDKIEKGEFVFSHSDIVHKKYHPHYRLIYGGFVEELQQAIL